MPNGPTSLTGQITQKELLLFHLSIIGVQYNISILVSGVQSSDLTYV